ncbi:MAG: phosphate ABC transporter permease PstA [Armatimonadota bacterium]|nr:phosphate ABC transporter permease PstA [Armatimonadota bacterium]
MSRYTIEKIAFAFLKASAMVVILPTFFIIFFIVVRGARGLTLEFLLSYPSQGMQSGGIFPAIVGTLYLIAGTILFSVPLGVLAAIYLAEYAKPGPLIRLIRLSIVNLAGVPSIVYGLFGFGIFVLMLKFGASILSGSLTLAILVLPLMIVASEEALLAVPQTFREASLALGATKWQTTRLVVLPNAFSGIITGIILAMGRAAGETAPILFTVAAFYLPSLPKSIYDQVMALPYHLYIISTQVPNAPPRMQWGTALTLLIIVLGLNLAAAIIRYRFRRHIHW